MAEGKLDVIIEELKLLRNGYQNIETQFKQQSAQISDLSTQLHEWKQTSETAFRMVNTEIAEVKTNVSQCSEDVMTLKDEIKHLQRSKAAKQILIEGMPHLQNEPLNDILRTLFKCLQIDPGHLFPSDAYRLGKFDPQRPRPPPIMLEFHSNHACEFTMKQWREKKMMFADEILPNFTKPGTGDRINIYLNKNYTPDVVAKLKDARKLKKHGFKIVYVYADKVYAKKSVVDQPIEIKDSQIINQLMASNPVIK